MLHYQATSGGFEFCGAADAPNDIAKRLSTGWNYYGVLNGMKAYSRVNSVVCVMPPGNLPFMQNSTLQIGAKTQRDFDAIALDLGVNFSVR
jgi:hypothetical protein